MYRKQLQQAKNSGATFGAVSDAEKRRIVNKRRTSIPEKGYTSNIDRRLAKQAAAKRARQYYLGK